MLTKAYYSFKKNSLKKPVYLIFFVTNKCNSKCNHCFYSKQLNKNTEDVLTLDQVEAFSKQLGKVIWLAISGGEPFLRDDLEDIYRIFCDNNKIEDINLPTNGVLAGVIYEKTKRMLELRQIKNFNVSISLDGTKETHNKIRGMDCFDKALETYDKLAELKKQHPNLKIKISTTISNNNIADIHDLISFVKGRMPLVDFHNFEIMRGNPKNKEYSAPTISQLENIKPRVLKTYEDYSFFGKRGLKSRIATNAKRMILNTHIKTLKERRQIFPCYAGIVHCVLDYNGDVQFCELGPKIGNIKQNTLEEIWNSKYAKEQREKIKNRGCYCTHSCFQNTNISFNHKLWPRFLLG